MSSLYVLYDNIEKDAMFRNSSNIKLLKGVTMLKNLKTWYIRRKAINELSALPDHLLRDIGIESRGQIARMVDGSLSRKPESAQIVKLERPVAEPMESLAAAA